MASNGYKKKAAKNKGQTTGRAKHAGGKGSKNGGKKNNKNGNKKTNKKGKANKTPKREKTRLGGLLLIFLGILSLNFWANPHDGFGKTHGKLEGLIGAFSYALHAALGKSLIVLVLALLIGGFLLLWYRDWFHSYKRTRFVIRVFASVFLAATIASGLGMVFWSGPDAGGFVGQAIYGELGAVSKVLIFMLAVLLLGFLWDLLSFKQFTEALRQAIKWLAQKVWWVLVKVLELSMAGCKLAVGYIKERVTKRLKKTPEREQVQIEKEELVSEVRSGSPLDMTPEPEAVEEDAEKPAAVEEFFTEAPTSPDIFPLEAVYKEKQIEPSAAPCIVPIGRIEVEDVKPDEPAERKVIELPTPIPLDILSPNMMESHDRERLDELKWDFEFEFRSHAKRKYGIILATSKEPEVGLTTICLNYSQRRESDDDKLADVLMKLETSFGLAIHRSPVKITIGTTVRVEIPLRKNERGFVAVRPTLEKFFGRYCANGDLLDDYHLIYGLQNNGELLSAPAGIVRNQLFTGTTGSGKTTMAHFWIISLLLMLGRVSKNLQLVLVDGKEMEFNQYDKILRDFGILRDSAYTKSEFSEVCEKLRDLHEKRRTMLKEDRSMAPKLSRVVVIIDEAREFDLHKIEVLASQCRSSFINILIGSQMAKTISVELRGLIPSAVGFKATLPSASQLTVQSGDALKLLGSGDGLLLCEEFSGLQRFQCPWVRPPDGSGKSGITDLLNYLQGIKDDAAGMQKPVQRRAI